MKTLAAFFVLILLCSCTPTKRVNDESAVEETPAPKVQLTLEQIQTHDFATSSRQAVVAAMRSVLENDGFVIKNTGSNGGSLVAQKQSYAQKDSEAFFNKIVFGSDTRRAKSSTVEASATVASTGRQTRAKVTFETKTVDMKGELMRTEVADDQKLYADFFAKTEKALSQPSSRR